jgi:hypothetical protein
MDLVVTFVVVALIALAAAIIIYFNGLRSPEKDEDERALSVPRAGMSATALADSPVSVRPAVANAPGPVAAPAAPPPLFDIDLEPQAAAPAAAEPVAASAADIRWWKSFDGRSESLDDTARLRLIGDLGVIGKDWCVPLLTQAYAEEQRPAHRQAALTALAACHNRAAAAAFRQALTSDDPAERTIAADGLADLEPAPQPTLRRTVERF